LRSKWAGDWSESAQGKGRQAGLDCWRLLGWLEPLGAELWDSKGVGLLREVFAQHYELEQDGKVAPLKVHTSGGVHNPHEPDAQWSTKGQAKQKKDWIGYKVQVAETIACDDKQSGFITSVLTQPATQSDEVGLAATLQKQEALGLERPQELYTDGAYISGQAIDQAKEEGWELVGPAQPSAARAGLEKDYRIEAFAISLRERKALSPQGKTSTACSKLTEAKTGKISYRFEFGSQCHSCPQKAACLPSAQAHRTITVGAHHESLQQRRRDQQSERNAIEGTLSELVRGYGLRRARYKGFAKVDLQNQFIAAACNIKRWFRKLLGTVIAVAQREESLFASA
jgi:transposase